RSSSLLHFLSILLPRPPTSPLFPYTTLFRSSRTMDRAPSSAVSSSERSISVPVSAAPACSRRSIAPSSSDRRPVATDPVRDRRRDRKSTRLNSSHDQISYAVFCLKKKNNKNT